MVGSPKLVRAVRLADVNPVGPGNLLETYITATDQFVRGQLYAETVMMQETLQFSSIDKGLETKIIEFQKRMRNQAAYFYDNLINGRYGYIAVIAGGYNVSALAMVSITFTVDDIEQAASNDKARQSAASAYSMLSDQAYQQSVLNGTLATKASSLDHSLAQYVADYRDALKIAEADLATAAKATLDEIEALRKAINQNIADIVAGGGEIGEAVTNLIVGVLTQIANDKPVKADKAAPTETVPAEKAGEGDSFSVMAISAAAAGGAKLSQAGKDLNANNDKLAAAYQRLAQYQRTVAVAKAVEVQNDLFAAMVPLAAAATHETTIAFQSVEASLAGFSASITTVTTDAAAAALAQQARRAEPLWEALNSELQKMKTMIIS